MNNNIIHFAPETDITPEGEKMIQANKSVVISCGESSITLHANGVIELHGSKIMLNGENVSLRGKTIHLND